MLFLLTPQAISEDEDQAWDEQSRIGWKLVWGAIGSPVPLPSLLQTKAILFSPSDYEVFLSGEIVPEEHLTQEHQAQQWARWNCRRRIKGNLQNYSTPLSFLSYLLLKMMIREFLSENTDYPKEKTLWYTRIWMSCNRVARKSKRWMVETKQSKWIKETHREWENRRRQYQGEVCNIFRNGKRHCLSETIPWCYKTKHAR